MDPLLIPLVQEPRQHDAEHYLGEIVARHADPIIGAIVRRKLYHPRHKQEIEDVCSDVRLRLLERLRELRADPDSHPIASFGDYVAVVAYHACDRFLRRVYPKRCKLKNRVQYLLEKHPSLALWDDDGEVLAGFAKWQNKKRSHTADSKIQRLIDVPEDWPFSNPAEHDDALALITAIFRHADGPVPLDRLVELVATLWQVRDEPPTKPVSERENGDDPMERIRDPQPEVSTTVSHRIYLERLWKEICDLPVRQRAALLMNLRDAQGSSMIELFPMCGIATLRDIAKTLEIAVAQFAILWSRLPMDDLSLSQHLGITRQQVINLRKCAKERLARRMKETPW